jgi:uncharacterized protein YbbC (DUF1343 family)/CubicO group peptidase (beta-lactamase class C family)
MCGDIVAIDFTIMCPMSPKADARYHAGVRARALGSIAALVVTVACASKPPATARPAQADAQAQAHAPAEPAPAPPVPASASTTARQPLELPAIDALLARAIAEHKLPGAVVAVGRRDGVVFERAYGQRAIVPSVEPMQADTIFDLASLSKAVATATVVVALAEEGRLSLDAPIGALLPEVIPRARAITPRELLLHTSGLPGALPRDQLDGGAAHALSAVLRVEPVDPRGARYRYSDVGFIWLGIMAARAAGEPLDALVRRVLSAPLALTDTGYTPSAALRPRIAPTEAHTRRPVPLVRGEVLDPLAYRLGGVAGNAGVFSTAADLSRVARMLLGGGALDGKRVLSEASAAALMTLRSAGVVKRTLGWDARSPHSRNRGALLSARAFGHGGHTGTALWIDPEQDLFVVFLSNRVHPDERGDVLSLIADVNDAAVRGVVQAAPCPLAGEPVRAGIDVLRAEGFARLAGKRIGLLTHRAARAADGRTTLELIAEQKSVTLAAVLTPEHGLDADVEGAIKHGALGATPIYSLFGRKTGGHDSYGGQRRPTPAMLEGLELLVIDLVDVGTRFYTYASTVREALIAARDARLPVLLLDRPNPIGASIVEGPMLDPSIRSFVNHHPLPLRHGLTLGELALLLASDLALDVQLQLVRVSGYERSATFEATGLAWSAPSPNLRTQHAALLYPAVGLLEGTVLAVGRGTDKPFEQIGAPFIDSSALLAALPHDLPGMRFAKASFTPSEGPFAGELCQGISLAVTDARAYSAVRTGIALIRALFGLYQARWEHAQLLRLLGHARTLRALERGLPFERLEPLWRAELDAFAARRERVLQYPTCGALPSL